MEGTPCPFLWAGEGRKFRQDAVRAGPKRCRHRGGDIMTPPASPLLSGYRMRLGSSTDKKDSGRLHVDFAQARDDFYEWECKQRMRAREERHRRKLEEDRLRPPSPPAIMHYSEHEAALLADKLKGRGPPSSLRPGGRHGPLAGQHRHPPGPQRPRRLGLRVLGACRRRHPEAGDTCASSSVGTQPGPCSPVFAHEYVGSRNAARGRGAEGSCAVAPERAPVFPPVRTERG